MDRHTFTSTPIYTGNKFASDPNFYHRGAADHDSTKDAASARSPTTVFAVTELNGVFRVPEDAVERGIPIDSRAEQTSSTARQQQQPQQQIRLSPSLICSFATDGELSTFSEDTEEGEEMSGNGSSTGIHRSRFTVPRRRSPHQSIFRPVGGTKRRCDFLDEDDEHSDSENHYDDVSSPAKRRCCSAPTLLHANPIASGDDANYDGSDDNGDFQPALSSAYSFASPIRRVRNDRDSIGASATIFAPLFAAADGATNGNPRSVEAAMDALDRSTESFSAATDALDRSTAFSIAPRELTRACPFGALPMLTRASRITAGEEGRREGESLFPSF